MRYSATAINKIATEMDHQFYPAVAAIADNVLMQAHMLYNTRAVATHAPCLRRCQQLKDAIAGHIQVCRTLLQPFSQTTGKRRGKIFYYINYSRLHTSRKAVLRLIEKAGDMESKNVNNPELFRAFSSKLKIMHSVMAELFAFEKAHLVPLLQAQNNYYLEKMEEEAL